MRRFLPLLMAYAAVAMALTWPVALDLGHRVPGAERTDLWLHMWILDFVADSIAQGQMPFVTQMLAHPVGGTVLVDDPLGAVLIAPFTLLFGVETSTTLLAWFQIAFAGVMAHGFAREWLNWRMGREPEQRVGAACVAGLAYCCAPIFISAVHNGQAGMGGGWAAWAAWMSWRAAAHGGHRRVEMAVASLAVACLSGWAGAATAFFFAAALALLGAGEGIRVHLRSRVLVLVLGLTVAIPMGMAMQDTAREEHSLAQPLTAQDAAMQRRSDGAADPVGYLMPGPYRSPNLYERSDFGDRRVHIHYLGWTLIGLSVLALRRRRRGMGFLWLGGSVGLLLSLGPVLVRHGEPVILAGRKAIPLPYLLVEGLPGLDSMSMLYTLAQGPALALALLASAAVAGGAIRWLGVALVLLFMEGRWASPAAGLPGSTALSVDPAVQALADAPQGAVVNFPVIAGRPYLYEQLHHGKPFTGDLLDPRGASAEQLWEEILAHADRDPTWLRTKTTASAQRLGIRYVLIHIDPDAQPDMHDIAIRALERAYLPMTLPTDDAAQARKVRVIKLW